MSDAPRRRHSDRVSVSPTFIGVGSKFTGNLECEGDLVLGGHVDGEGLVKGTLTLSEGSRWDGKIDAVNAIVAGEVIGTLIVAEKLEIRKTARIRGSVQARSIAVAQGAVIDGEMSVTSEMPVVNFEEKRKA
jgi:cytoskeletal protein CcmA (bactofilin family)